MSSRHFCWVNSMKDRKKPAIRFKGFTEDWEHRKLSELCFLVTKGTTPLDKSSIGTVNFVKIESIDEVSGEIKIMQKITDEEHNGYLRRSQLKKGDILFSIAGTLGRVTAVKSGILPANTNQALAIIRLKSGCLQYIKTYLKGKAVADFIKENPTIGAQPNLSLEQVGNLEISLPTENEQKFIGAYFQHLNNLITLHQRKYDKLVNVKKSMLEKIFPKNGESIPDIRFSGFTEDWEQRKLGEMVSFSKGSGYSKGDLKENGTPIILYGRLYTKYETIISEVDTFADYKKGSVYSKGGEVIVPASGETAEDISIASVVEKSNILLGGDLNVITPQDYLDSPFLAISISNGKPHNDMAKMAQGKSVVHLHNSDLEKIELPYPCIAEQRKISRFFSNLDKLITLHQRKLEKLKNIKKSCLEKMFI